MSDLRWLVTGAEGQLGRSFMAQTSRQGIDAIGLSRRELDIELPESIDQALRDVRPTAILNAAAFTAVDLCEQEADAAHRTNALAPATLARLCRGRALLVHVSTEYVFGGADPRPIPEDARLDPRSTYGRTKAAGEVAVRESECEHLIVRTQWLYGPGRNFVRTILDAARRGGPLRVVEDQLGRPTWTGALAPGLLQAVDCGLRGTLHLACEGIASWYELARDAVLNEARRDRLEAVEVRPIATSDYPRPAERPAYGVLGLSRARDAGIWLPHWRDALRTYLDQNHEAEEPRHD